MALTIADKQIDKFAVALDTVMKRLEKNLIDVLAGAKTGSVIDATTMLNSKDAMLQALADSGYYALAEAHVATFTQIPAEVIAEFKKRGLPAPEFTTADAKTFETIARANLERFNVAGVQAVDEIRLGLVTQAVSSAPFSNMVDAVRAATVGVDKAGGPLAKYAYTYANTAILQMQGDAIIAAGESIGADKYEVLGPLDSKTRDVCREALANPIRTKEEWIAAGYWGGEPGGWNCRHQLLPVFD